LVGNIYYSRSKIVSAEASECLNNIITIGPVSILPEYQGKGIGSKLITKSIEIAKDLGFEAIVIYGDPRYYHRFGFRCAEKWDIATADGKYAVSLMALPLQENIFHNLGTDSRFHESSVFETSWSSSPEFEVYDSKFLKKEKGYDAYQDTFKLLKSLTY